MEIVDLPSLKRGVEWPTVALAVAIYGLWLLATFFIEISVVGVDCDRRVGRRLAATSPA